MALPALIGGWVAASLATSIGTIIARGLLALGIGYTTYNFGLPAFMSFFQSAIGSVPAEIRAGIGLAKLDVAITIIVSAVAAKMGMRMVWRRL